MVFTFITNISYQHFYNMKKQLLTILLGGLAFTAQAQKAQIRAAERFLSERDLAKAKEAIDAAANDPTTKDNARTWYVRGIVYLNMAHAENDNKQSYKEAGSSFKKVVQIDPGYEKADMDNRIYATAIHFFNNGIAMFKGQAYPEAASHFGEVAELYNLGGGKRFASNKSFDTISKQASLYRAYSLYHDNKYDEAFPLLLAAKNDPVVKSATIYLQLCDIYDAKGDNAALLATIQEGRKEFPNDKAILSRELNYYIKTGKSEDLIQKLEAAIASEPDNAQLVYILAQTYESMANPRDNQGKELPVPANYEELFEKAATNFQRAAIMVPQEAGYAYGLGALYFNRGVLLTHQMNAITGFSAAEVKQHDALKAQRDEWFSKALPHLVKTINLLQPKADELSGEDRATYIDAIRASQEIYARQNNQEKATEMKKLFDSLK